MGCGCPALCIDAAEFTGTPTLARLAAGEAATITVTAEIEASGPIEGLLRIETNDLANAVIEIPLTASGLGDNDEDGYARGEDCDDRDATINPGATETWYDGTDQDCDGASDYDQDGDGADAITYGGTDCDDTDPTSGTGGAEEPDGLDDDCDGVRGAGGSGGAVGRGAVADLRFSPASASPAPQRTRRSRPRLRPRPSRTRTPHLPR